MSKTLDEMLKVADRISHTLDYEPDILETLSHLREAGTERPLSQQRRRELLSASRAGEVVELELDAITFRQSKAPRPLAKKDAKFANATFVKFRDRDLIKFGKSFKSRPMLRDHDRNDLLKRGGTIIASEMSETESEFQLRQTLKLVKPWAVEAALDGTLQTFSIGWDPPTGGRRAVLEAITCTVCEKSMFLSDCPHMPGEEHKVADTGEVFIVEAEFKNPRGAEVSGVSFPAVKGTQVESVRAALSEARSIQPHRKARRMNPETLKALGLPADATEEQIDAKVRSLSAGTPEIQTQLKAAELKAKEAITKLAANELATKEAADLAKTTRLTELRTEAIATGRWKPGDDREGLFDDFAELSVAHAERYFDSLDAGSGSPVGQPLTAKAASVVSTFAATPIGMTMSDLYMASALQISVAEKTFRKMGITPEIFAKYGPHIWECRDPDDAWLDDGAGSLTGLEIH